MEKTNLPHIELRGSAKSANLDLNDPLGTALKALQGSDPLVQGAKKQIWRKLWVRDTINDWISRIDTDPKFFKELHKAIPDDVELLREMRDVAMGTSKTLPAICIVGLVNERLERCYAAQVSRSCDITFPISDRTNATLFSKVFQGKGLTSHYLNYTGFACAGIQTAKGDRISFKASEPEGELTIPAKTPLSLTLWMQPDRPKGVWAENVLVETGVDSDMVSFGFEIDCATLHFPYGQKRIRFHRREKSSCVSFDFNTTKRIGQHVVIVALFQERTLIKTFEVILNIRASR